MKRLDLLLQIIEPPTFSEWDINMLEELSQEHDLTLGLIMMI